MKRVAMDNLVEWKSSPTRKPLLLFGARQVGKSYLLEQFARRNYESYVLLNLEEQRYLHAAFEGDLSPKSILSKLEQLLGVPVRTTDALIVFDEIQACDAALTSLKYFQEEAPQYHVIGAGSLLGAAVRKRGQSFPVGKVDELTLHPMTFDEFLLGLGYESMLDGIAEAYVTRAKYALHERAMELFWTYLLVGGMPEAVSAYRETGSLRMVSHVHHGILNQYVGDMAKYAENPVDIARARAAWDSVPAQLAKENRKFQFNKVAKGGRSSQYVGALDWLVAAGLIVKCHQVDSGQVPLSFHENPDAFKVYANDTGLLSTKAEIPPAAILDERLRGMLDRGGIVENYVIQQMVARGIRPRYWTNRNRAEIDLVVEDGSASAVPIEVKSSENVRSRSLSAYAEKFGPARMVRVSAKNFGSGKVESIPLYAAGLLADEVASSKERAWPADSHE